MVSEDGESVVQEEHARFGAVALAEVRGVAYKDPERRRAAWQVFVVLQRHLPDEGVPGLDHEVKMPVGRVELTSVVPALKPGEAVGHAQASVEQVDPGGQRVVPGSAVGLCALEVATERGIP